MNRMVRLFTDLFTRQRCNQVVINLIDLLPEGGEIGREKIPVVIAQYPSPDAYSGMHFQSQGFLLGLKLWVTGFAV